MKIQLDTVEKTINVEETVNLNKLFKAIKKLLPNGEWKEFTLKTNSIMYWYNPIISTSTDISSSTYCVEV